MSEFLTLMAPFSLNIPDHVRTELSMFAVVLGAMLCLSGVKLVAAVRGKFYDKRSSRTFRSTKRLCLKDYLLLEMLQGRDSSYCVTDPDEPDNPIVFSSDGFCRMTQYSHEESEGRNCRFLQGPATRQEGIDTIRAAVTAERCEHVELINYKKDGTTFANSFFLCPLFDDNHKLSYFVGIQAEAGKSDEENFYANILFSDFK